MLNIGKHKKEAQEFKYLKEEIKEKEKEIQIVKSQCAEQFKKIYDISEKNSLGNENIKVRKMGEIAKENFIILLKAMLKGN